MYLSSQGPTSPGRPSLMIGLRGHGAVIGQAAAELRPGGGQPAQAFVEDVFVLLLPAAVVGSEDGGEAAQQGEFPDRIPAQGSREAAHGQGVGPVTVDDLQRGGQHHLRGDLAVPARTGVFGRAARGWWGHR
jgi:hypothetical protein